MGRKRLSDAERKHRDRERIDKRRAERWTAAALAAHSAGYPINTFVTVTLHRFDERERGARALFIAADFKTQESRLWAALRRVAQAHCGVWIAMRAPEHDRGKGRHVHIACHLPDDASRMDAIVAMERVTGAATAWFKPRGARLGRLHGVVAKSAGGAWMIQRDMGSDPGNPNLIDYIAKASGKAKVEAQHRLSDDLSALVKIASDTGGQGGIRSPQGPGRKPIDPHRPARRPQKSVPHDRLGEHEKTIDAHSAANTAPLRALHRRIGPARGADRGRIVPTEACGNGRPVALHDPLSRTPRPD